VQAVLVAQVVRRVLPERVEQVLDLEEPHKPDLVQVAQQVMLLVLVRN
jgi:hypothetical protein